MRRTAVLVIDTSQSMQGEPVRGGQGGRARVHLGRARQRLGRHRRRSPARSPRPSPRRPTATRRRAVLDGLTLTKQTRLYDGVVQAVDMAGTEGQRSLLVLSDGADTSQTPDRRRPPRRSRTPGCSPTWSPSTRTAAAPRRPRAAGHRRPGPGHLVRPGRPAGGLRGRGRRPGPPGAGHRHPALGLRQDRGARSRSPCPPPPARSPPRPSRPSSRPAAAARPGRRPWTPPSWSLYAGPAALALGLVVLASRCSRRARRPAQRRRPGHPLHRGAGRRRAPRAGTALLDTDVTFASAKETAANVLRRNQDLDARISARLQGAGSELKSSEWLLVHGGDLLRRRPRSVCCSAAATC